MKHHQASETRDAPKEERPPTPGLAKPERGGEEEKMKNQRTNKWKKVVRKV